MKEKANHDFSISLIRLISTILIITCHIMQYLSIELAWWFNVGVQIFLCLSGYLYGKRDTIRDDLSFYKKNFVKILVDYYVVIIPAMLLYAVLIPEHISITKTINMLLVQTYGTLDGGGHLWYVPYCLLCYLITPFLSRYFEKQNHVVKAFLTLSLLAIVAFETFFPYFTAAWIFCYMLGFFLGVITKQEKIKLYRNTSLLIISAAIAFNAIQIVQDYVLKAELNGTAAWLYGRHCNYAHVFLGVTLFIVFKAVFSKVFQKEYPASVKKICLYSDEYSYDVYLVHSFIIVSPLSLVKFTDSIILNIALIMVIVVVLAVIVHFISSQIKSKWKA